MTYKPKVPELLKSPFIFKKLARRLAILLLLFFIAIAFLPWQQTIKGRGRVIAYSATERLQVVTAPIAGRISKWYITEGSVVKKGDPIVELRDNDPDLINRLKIERDALELKLKVSEQALKIANINVNRQKVLYEKGIHSRRRYEQAKYEQIRYQNDVANAKVAIAQIKVRLARQKRQLIKAPMDGTILRRVTGQGTILVQQGAPLCELVPMTNSRAVELWVNGNDVPLIDKRSLVRLQFEGWPAIQFSGWPSIAIGTFGGIVAVIDSADNGQGMFRLLVVPDEEYPWPDKRYLRQGVRVQGWVILGRVHLWYELWRRFNGFPPERSKLESRL